MQTKPIRVLHVLETMVMGGIESFVMNVYRNIDRNKVQFDFLEIGPSGTAYADKITSLGGKLFSVARNRRKHPIKSICTLDTFFKEHPEYNIVHQHTFSNCYLEPIVVAKRNKIHTRILHCHCVKPNKQSIRSKISDSLGKKLFQKYATHHFACSLEAGKWMFDARPFKIIQNGINMKNFRFDEAIRTEYRSQLGLEKSFVIGHVGRLTEEKNHMFLCDIFHQIYKKNEKARLLIIGDGKLKEVLKQKIENLGLSHAVQFLGARKDISKLLQAMDVFVFPSLCEGLGIALIEAQVSGLPCIISNTIPSEVVLTRLVQTLPLESPSTIWAESCFKHTNTFQDRKQTFELLAESQYNIKYTTQMLEKLYLDSI